MPEWIFAFIILIILCAAGVYIIQGIDGFINMTSYGTSAQDAIAYALSLGMAGSYTPSSSSNRGGSSTPFSCATYKGTNCNTLYSCCVSAANGELRALQACRIAFNSCSSASAAYSGTPGSGNTSSSDLNTLFNNYALSQLSERSKWDWTSSDSPYKYSPTVDQLNSAQGGNSDWGNGATPSNIQEDVYPDWYVNHQKSGGSKVFISPNDFGTNAATIINESTVSPSLRDLIRSDMDEAVAGVVDKEILQLQNQNELQYA
jgi:hypothetical protein